MTEFKIRRGWLIALLATTVLAGCGTTPAEDHQAVNRTDSKAAFDINQPAHWSTPFWEKESSGDQGNQQQSGADNTPAPQFVKRNEPLSNVGLIVKDGVSDSLPQALSDQAGKHGLLVLPQAMLQDALQHDKSCAQPDSEACLSALAVYPGVRLLATLTPAANGKVAVEIRDTVLGKRYSEDVAADAGGARQLLDDMATQASMVAWSARPFPGGDNDLYISAGRVNGLAVGTELAVREPGKPVRTPSGQVVAWHPGKIVGKARVSQWVNALLSKVTPESGQAPGPDSRLTLMPDGQ